MAKEQLSTRQRQLRELEEQAQEGGVSVVDGANRSDSHEPEFVVPGPGGQFVGEDVDDGKSPADLTVRRTASVRAQEQAAKDADKKAKGDGKDASAAREVAPQVTRGDNEK